MTHKCRPNDRPKSRTNAQVLETTHNAQMPLYVVGGSVCGAVCAQVPHPSALVQEAFSVNPRTGVWIERSGRTTRGTRPCYLDWPMVRGDEFGPPIVPQAELARQSKVARP